MSKLWVGVQGNRFIDKQGRQVILRGLNLGGDCKLPYPDGGTDQPTDFGDHRSVSFVGRPFPLAEADEHLGRIAGWGFNMLRLLVTWEAVEHAGPGLYDLDYIDYIGKVCERAQAHGLALFVDFHQDAWSRMSGGSGAPGWIFAKLGIDFRRFDAAGAAHVMQYRYDYSNPQRRQEDRYPSMSWPLNYRMPANGIMWSAFFAGATLTPDWKIGTQNVQHYLQSHYFGAVRALAARLRDQPNVIGFDSLNEPGLGWIGQKLSERPGPPAADDSSPMRLGPAWSPLDGLKAARGLQTTIPFHTRNKDGSVATRELQINTGGVSIWMPGVDDPFERAGAWRVEGGRAEAVDEEFFRQREGRRFDHERDFMQPFFHAMAATIREVNPDWLLFAEINPHVIIQGRSFPKEMPPATINASHWYDVSLLWSKRFPAEPGAADKEPLRKLYGLHMAYLRSLGDRLNGGAPTLIGEFGIPYDLNDGDSFRRWAAGERGAGVWKPQAAALQLMYETLDLLLLSSTQWNYTASNRNDLRIGDGWNQEDLSVYSRDQQSGADDGGRAVAGYCRPYVRRAQGKLLDMSYTPEQGAFCFGIEVNPAIDAPSEIYLPEIFAAQASRLELSGIAAEQEYLPERKCVLIRASEAGTLRGELKLSTANA